MQCCIPKHKSTGIVSTCFTRVGSMAWSSPCMVEHAGSMGPTTGAKHGMQDCQAVSTRRLPARVSVWP